MWPPGTFSDCYITYPARRLAYATHWKFYEAVLYNPDMPVARSPARGLGVRIPRRAGSTEPCHHQWWWCLPGFGVKFKFTLWPQQPAWRPSLRMAQESSGQAGEQPDVGLQAYHQQQTASNSQLLSTDPHKQFQLLQFSFKFLRPVHDNAKKTMDFFWRCWVIFKIRDGK